MASRDPHAIIIGAGIAGLSTAYWLAKAGWGSTILEYHDSIAPGGHVMHIFGPGYQTLRRMNLKDLVINSYKHSDSVVRDSRGREILRHPYADIHAGVETLSTCRGDLALAIAGALPKKATIRFGARIDALQDHGDKVTVELEGGEVLEADLLIGADGSLSATRDSYWEDEKWAEILGYYYSTYDVKMDHKLDSYCQSYSAPGHIDVLYAPQKGRVAALHIWREDHIKPPAPNELKYDVLRRVISKKNTTVSEVLHAAEKAVSVPVLNRAFMVVLDEWSRGRVVLVGDAAYCFAPWSSHGAGMAMASAEVMSEELLVGGSLGDALVRWEKRVRPSVERLQMRIRATAPKLIAKNTPVYAVRALATRALGQEKVGSWQALGIAEELKLAKLDERELALSHRKGISAPASGNKAEAAGAAKSGG